MFYPPRSVGHGRRGADDWRAPCGRLPAWAAAVLLHRVGWCREHRRWRATCVQCGQPLATALCALRPAQRQDRCPCRRRQSVPDI